MTNVTSNKGRSEVQNALLAGFKVKKKHQPDIDLFKDIENRTNSIKLNYDFISAKSFNGIYASVPKSTRAIFEWNYWEERRESR